MARTPVNSSNLRSVGYDDGAATLEIEFQDGRIYQFGGVAKHTYGGLMEAWSKGNYFHEYIKDRYRCLRVR